LLVRGKEPKILIDDKPVELNLQQLQDLLEALPGSAIEKIEVLTNPPPQYANESSVINIVTKKGRVGRSGRISVYGGTMGEKGTNLSYNYRKQGLSVSIYAGVTSALYKGNGYSLRENRYADSINHFRSDNDYANKTLRPNLRTNIDYDVNKNHAVNFVLQYNQGNNLNKGITEYRNINRFGELYRFSTRDIESDNDNYNPNLSLNYTFRSGKAGEILRIFSNANFSSSESNRDLLLNYFNPDLTLSHDSLQSQNNSNKTHGYNVRLAYDLPIRGQKTFLSLGSFYTVSHSRIIVDAAYKKKGVDEMVPVEALSNDFYFHQYVTNGRLSVKQIIAQGFNVSSGLSVEFTNVQFELFKNDSSSKNSFENFLPFFTLNKNWEDKLNLTATYRKTIRRPGINEQNPSIDYSDPYNIRFGNSQLEPASTHNFDLILGKTTKDFYVNLGLGYNAIKDIFSQVRIPVSDSKTETSWLNISDKHEYEISSWSGYTLWKKLRMNLSASFTHNEYIHTRQTINNRFVNAGSLTSNFNANYTWKELYTVTGHVTYNRFANPQGTVRANVSMNLGAQAKLLQKKMVLSLNLVDPFNQQENRTFTYGNTFSQENYNLTKTRNFRLTIAYNFTAAVTPRKNISKDDLKKMLN
jgi:outer membrane receptor protein involved in Fe transport